MIVGNGLVANSCKQIDDEKFIFFASGVSNSLETDSNQFERESNLLQQTIRQAENQLLIYFSSTSIYDTSVNHRPYVQHKLNMEQMIQKSGRPFLILRLSNLVGKGGNPNTLMNFLVHSIRYQTTFNIWQNATRNLLDTEDMIDIVKNILDQDYYNHIFDIAYIESFSIEEIVSRIETHLNLKANYSLQEGKGSRVNIDTAPITQFYDPKLLNREVHYIDFLLDRYYS